MIGVGNPWRGDDGAGPWVAERLRRSGMEVLELPGEGSELIEAWTGLDWVVVVDAVRSGAEPGHLHRLEAASAPLPSDFFAYSTHQFGLAEAAETARALGRLPRRLTIYGIEGAKFDFGQGLTPEVERTSQTVAEEIAAYCNGSCDIIPPPEG